MLWLRVEVFDYALIPIPHNSHTDTWTIQSIQKTLSDLLAEYTTDNKITATNWRKYSTSQLGLEESRADLMFDMLITLSDESNQLWCSYSEKLLAASTETDLDELREDLSVDVYSLVFYMWAQLFHSASFEANVTLLSAEDSPRSNRTGSSPRSSPSKSRSDVRRSKHSRYLNYFISCLPSLLQIAGYEPTEEDQGDLLDFSKVQSIDQKQFERLGFMLQGGPSPGFRTISLCDAVTVWKAEGMTGSERIQIEDLEKYMIDRVVVNKLMTMPQYDQSMLGKPSSDAHGLLSPKRADSLDGADSIMDIDTECVPTRRFNQIKDMISTTDVFGDKEFLNSVVRITQCHKSFIYLLSAMDFVTIDNCSNCTILVGACQNVLKVDSCERVTIISCSHRMRISNCTETRFFTCTNASPVLIGTNHLLQFAPYNTFYPSLTDHLETACINPSINFWDRPMYLSSRTSSSSSSSAQLSSEDSLTSTSSVSSTSSSSSSTNGNTATPDDGTFVKMDPSDFSSFTVPFQLTGSCEANPCALPQEYEHAWLEKLQGVQEINSQIAQAGFDGPRRAEMQDQVEGMFQDWLAQSGNLRQIQDLLHLNNVFDEE